MCMCLDVGDGRSGWGEEGCVYLYVYDCMRVYFVFLLLFFPHKAPLKKKNHAATPVFYHFPTHFTFCFLALFLIFITLYPSCKLEVGHKYIALPQRVAKILKYKIIVLFL